MKKDGDDAGKMIERANRPLVQDIQQRSAPKDSETAMNTEHERAVEDSVEVGIGVTRSVGKELVEVEVVVT